MTARTCRGKDCGSEIFPQRLRLPRGNSHFARGLCANCYDKARNNGTLADYPRATWSRDELMDEWDRLRREGVRFADAGARIGVKQATFDRAFRRARAAGDPRAINPAAVDVYSERWAS